MKSTIIAIAQREADRAADRAQQPKDAAVIYFETVTEVRQRGLKAEEILAAGLVSPNGAEGSYYVQSQSGNGRYTVDLPGRECDCPDHMYRGKLCKHLIACELYEAQDLDPFAPDYEALGRERVTSQNLDSADAAGYYTPAHHGFAEAEWEAADYYHDMRRDGR